MRARKRIVIECFVCKKPFEIRQCDTALIKTCSKPCSLKKRSIVATGRPMTWGDKIRAKRKGTKSPWTQTPEYRANMSRTMKAIREKCNFWKGGIMAENNAIRSSLEYKNWRRMVFDRDQFICQKCGNTGRVHAHHIKPFALYPELRFSIENGLTLCKPCHKLEHLKIKKPLQC